MRVFEAHTYLAETPADYLTLIERALHEDSPAQQQQRRAFAATHTWPHSVARIYQAIADCYAQRGQPAARPSHPPLVPTA